MPRAKKLPPVHSITGVGVPLSQDLAGRQRRYFISMMIRTACFILTVIVPNPWRWFFFVGSFVLPYIAVVVANAGREQETKPTAFVPRPEISS